MFDKTKVLVTAAAFALPAAAAASTVVNSVDNGWYNANGYHSSSTPHTTTGLHQGMEYRGFYVFDTAALGQASSISITFQAYNGYFVSPDGSETIVLFDFLGSISDLVSGTNGMSNFNDLGSGAVLGSHVIAAPSYSYMPQFTVTLGSAFVSQFNSVAGSPGSKIALGARMTSLSGSQDQGYWFGGSMLPGAYLTINPQTVTPAVPEPTTWAMFLLGFGAIGYSMRSRKVAYRGLRTV